ncbi:MAG: hypothetical protein ACK559_05205, partial [bacterium]
EQTWILFTKAQGPSFNYRLTFFIRKRRNDCSVALELAQGYLTGIGYSAEVSVAPLFSSCRRWNKELSTICGEFFV